MARNMNQRVTEYRVALAAWTLAVAASGLMMCACQEPLFIRDEPRSQYDRTAAIRDRRAPDFLTDEFGSRRPNIRGRLLGTD